MSLAGIERDKHAFDARSCSQLKGTLTSRGGSYDAKGKNNGEDGRRKLHRDLVGEEVIVCFRMDIDDLWLYLPALVMEATVSDG